MSCPNCVSLRQERDRLAAENRIYILADHESKKEMLRLAREHTKVHQENLASAAREKVLVADCEKMAMHCKSYKEDYIAISDREKILVEALEFYADDEVYNVPVSGIPLIALDDGARARAPLKGEG